MSSNRDVLLKLMVELEKHYSLFSIQWNDWLIYKHADDYLTQEEIYALSVYNQNNFHIEIEDHIMFYHRTELVLSITKKLIRSRNEFEEWLIKR